MNPFRPPGSPARTPVLASIPTAVGNGSVSLRLYDPIDSWGGEWGVSAKEFAAAIDALPDGTTEIRVLINSPGGEVFEGIAIMNALRAHSARVVAVVEGLAASAASFIAASADEVVMMRNSEMFIHNAWGFAMGDAEVMRDSADRLEHFDRNLAAIYATKSGKSIDYWMAEMPKDRWLSAEEAVAEKLADRIEGEAEADAARARFDMTAFARHVPKPADTPQAAQLPDSSEPGDPNQKEKLSMSDTIKAGLRERLGVTDAEATDETLLAALDQALSEQAEPTTTPPAGTVLMDAAALDTLKADASAGREARNELDKQRRDRIVAKALEEGRIAPASRDTWRASLDENEKRTAELLGTFAANTVPVTELGHSNVDAVNTAEDEEYYAMFPDERPTEKGA